MTISWPTFVSCLSTQCLEWRNLLPLKRDQACQPVYHAVRRPMLAIAQRSWNKYVIPSSLMAYTHSCVLCTTPDYGITYSYKWTNGKYFTGVNINSNWTRTALKKTWIWLQGSPTELCNRWWDALVLCLWLFPTNSAAVLFSLSREAHDQDVGMG